jgi:hypothetical protein
MPYVSSGYDFRPRHNMSYSPCAQYTKWLRPRIEASHTGACHKYWFRNTNIPKPICVTRDGALRISFALIYTIFVNYLKFMEPKKRSKCVSSFRFGSVPRLRTGSFGIPSTGIQPYGLVYILIPLDLREAVATQRYSFDYIFCCMIIK